MGQPLTLEEIGVIEQEAAQVIYDLWRLVDELDAYVDFLNEANNGPISIAALHGWICPKSDIDKGVAFRERIAELRKGRNSLNEQ